MDSVKSTPAALRVAIAGLGPIGKSVAQALDRGIGGLVLAAVSGSNPEKHLTWLGALARSPPFCRSTALLMSPTW